MKRKDYPLDPEDDATTHALEQIMAESLSPIPLASDRHAKLRERIVARAKASKAADRAGIRVPMSEAQWQRLVPGVRVRHLSGDRRAVMLELAPGASLPMHRHHEDEECVVLRGEAQLGDITVRQGDYHVAYAQSRHGRVSSRSGALIYLRGTPIGHGAQVARDLVTALLPGEGRLPTTIRADEGQWADVVDGVQRKLLHDDGEHRSMLVRLAPGARVPPPDPVRVEECLLLDGELFMGDWLMRPGDYHLSPGNGPRLAAESDVGALMFLRLAPPASHA